jgi:hypothetical protein
LDMNHRSSKVVTLSKGTSASALTRNVCPQTTKKKPMSLDTSDVVRDVETSLLLSLTAVVGVELAVAQQ